jgi:ABC-type lipoprotein release transport system permease subunit
MFRLTVKIAWASLFRRRTRSLLVVLMIAVSLWGLLFMEGIYDGMTAQMINNAIRSDSGHISVFGHGYRLDPDLSRQIENVARLDAFLSADSRVAGYVQRIRQDGLVATAHYSRATVILGVDLSNEDKISHLSNYLQQGKFSFGSRSGGAVIGSKLAAKLQVQVGSKIILSALDSHGEVSAMPFRISGILKTNNMALDENAVFISTAKARRLLSLDDGVSQVAIMLHDESFIARLQQDLRRTFPHLDILRWDELYPALMQSRVLMQGFNLVVSLLVFCVAALGIFGVMLVSVLERLREFGIMLALGSGFALIRNIILVESFFLGFSGFAAGGLIGWATLVYFKAYGLDLSMFSDAFDEFGMDAVTFAVIRSDYFIIALVAVILAVVLSVLIPLRVLKKARPIQAIHLV